MLILQLFKVLTQVLNSNQTKTTRDAENFEVVHVQTLSMYRKQNYFYIIQRARFSYKNSDFFHSFYDQYLIYMFKKQGQRQGCG